MFWNKPCWGTGRDAAVPGMFPQEMLSLRWSGLICSQGSWNIPRICCYRSQSLNVSLSDSSCLKFPPLIQESTWELQEQVLFSLCKLVLQGKISRVSEGRAFVRGSPRLLHCRVFICLLEPILFWQGEMFSVLSYLPATCTVCAVLWLAAEWPAVTLSISCS